MIALVYQLSSVTYSRYNTHSKCVNVRFQRGSSADSDTQHPPTPPPPDGYLASQYLVNILIYSVSLVNKFKTPLQLLKDLSICPLGNGKFL